MRTAADSHRPMSRAGTPIGPGLLVAALCLGGCSAYAPFDSVAYLRDQYAQRLDDDLASGLVVPFALTDEIRASVATEIVPARDEARRVEQVEDFIFRRLGLRYALTPTRDAVDTYTARQGNCLSFVNLFIGVGRELRLDPFYVEVTDFKKWRFRQGMVVSQGHIVAGLRLKTGLRTFDFLPYKPKPYKNFRPIDDLRAAAHYYNNLAGEALLQGDTERALELATTASRLAPDFLQAINNLGVALARQGRFEDALETYRRGLELAPEDVAILSNSARAYQQLGLGEEADAMLARLHGFQHANPFYYLYLGELALLRDDPTEALAQLQEAYRLDTELPEVHLGLVKTYLALGDTDKARHHLARAIRLDATNPEAIGYAELLGSE